VASKLEVSFDQVAAALAAATRLNKDAAINATGLRQVLSTILKPCADAKKALEEIGLSSQGLRDKLAKDGLIATLEDLDEAFGGDIEKMARVFPNVRAITHVFNLLGKNLESTKKIFKSLAETTEDDLKVAFERASASPMHAFRQQLGAIQSAAIAVGDAIVPVLLPAVKRMTERVMQAAQWFRQLAPPIKSTILAIGGVVALVGPATMALGLVAAGVAGIVSAVAAVGGIGGMLATVLPVVGALGAAFVAVGSAVAAAVALVRTKWRAVTELAGDIWLKIKPVLVEIRAGFASMWNQLSAHARDIWAELVEIFDGAVTLITGLWHEHGDGIVTKARWAWQVVRGIVTNAIDGIGGVIKSFLRLIQGDWSGAWNAIKDTADRVVGRGLGRIIRGGLQLATSELWGFASTAGKVVLKIIGVFQGLGAMYLALPWIDPLTRAAARKGLESLASGAGAIQSAITGAADKQLEWAQKSERTLRPIREGLVEMESGWVEVLGAQQQALTYGQQELLRYKESLGQPVSMPVTVTVDDKEVKALQERISRNPLKMDLDQSWLETQIRAAAKAALADPGVAWAH
jgi:hypothetical protein